MRGLTAAICALTAVVVYIIPTSVELAMLRNSLSPWICAIIGDFFGCAIVFGLGYRKTAGSIYVSATAVEISLLFFKIVPPKSVVFLTNALPTLALCAIFSYAIRLDAILKNEYGER